MKKIIFILAITMSLLLCVSLTAQERNITGSVGLAYGLDIEELGLQLGGYTHINPEMRLGGDITWWLVDKGDFDTYTVAEFNFNFHYIFSENNGTTIYGLGTLGYHYYEYEYDHAWGKHSYDDSDIALGIGAGFEFDVEPVILYAEPRLFLSGYDQLVLSGGVRFRF